MRTAFQKIFSNKKTLLPFFISVLVLEVAIVILSMIGEQHWIIFANALTLVGLMVAIFITAHFNKIKAVRSLSTIALFIQTIVTTAYSFMSYPKAPSSSFAGFVIYIIYAVLFFALFLTLIILHVNLSKETNSNVLFALHIMCAILVLITLMQVIYSCVLFGRAGYSNMLMVDFLNYISFAMMVFYILTNETIMLPQVQNKK